MSIKITFLKIIKYIPSYTLKNFLFRNILGYSIGDNVKIGRSFINCNKVTIGNNVYIADNNTIICKEVKVGSNTKIHSGNNFIGGASFTIGNNSRIINNHYFDLWNDISIGNNTWIAGKNTEFWTHGSIQTKKNKNLSIHIKDNIYIGSASKIAPGVIVASVNIIGLGSVVMGDFVESETIIIGNPAKIVKKNIDWRVNW